VAEQFGMLEALHPGRVDLGIGRAPGTDALTASALRRTADGLSADDFPRELSELMAFFDGSFPDGHPYQRIAAVPARDNAPALWLLGSSGYSAQVAGLLGLPFAFAHHFSAANTLPALKLYRSTFRPSSVLQQPYAMVAVAVVCAETDAEAERLASSLALAAARRRSRVDAAYTPVQHALRSRVAARRLGAVDGAVLMGAEFGLPEGTRYVTLSDLTLVQARATHPVFSRLSDGVFRAWEARQREVYARAVACCAASHWTAASLREDYGLPAEKVRVVGLGPNHEPAGGGGAAGVGPDSAAAAGGARDWAAPRFLFVGREWERKHGPAVLSAFASLRAERPDARLDLVGGHPPVRADGVTGHGALRLDVPEEAARVRALFAAATCFVMPSEVEPFGLAYIEAAAAGAPSIATSVGGAGTIVAEGTGLLVAPEDGDALLAAMRTLADGETARRMGEAARERSRLFTWERVGARLLSALGLPGGEGAEFL
jgi:glycosyltransferase involved in cell wall biosynthesis